MTGHHEMAEGECRNCGAIVTGAYCAACGQKADVHRTVHEFVHDLAHGVAHFDGKLWRTLPLLAWRPGQLTRRYAHGERMKFVSPVAMFLFATFLAFMTFALLPSATHVGDPAAMAELQRETAEIERQIAAGKAAGRDVAKLEQERDVLKAVGGLGGVRDVETVADDAVAGTEAPGKTVILGGKGVDANLARVGVDIDGTPPFLAAAMHKLAKDPQLVLYKLQNYGYKYAWAMIPISAALLWLLFAARRDVTFYDHIVFVTYSLTFVLFLFILLRLLGALGLSSGAALLMFTTIVPVHFYRQLKGAYRGSVAMTLIRTVVLLLFAAVSLLLFGALLLYLGLH